MGCLIFKILAILVTVVIVAGVIFWIAFSPESSFNQIGTYIITNEHDKLSELVDDDVLISKMVGDMRNTITLERAKTINGLLEFVVNKEEISDNDLEKLSESILKTVFVYQNKATQAESSDYGLPVATVYASVPVYGTEMLFRAEFRMIFKNSYWQLTEWLNFNSYFKQCLLISK